MQYISNTDQDRKEMLRAVGVPGFESLIAGIPGTLKKFDLKLPNALSELELLREMVEIGRQNKNFHDYASYLGAGNYDHFVPTAVNSLAHRAEFITAYTPYQGEASQGSLQSIYEFQSLMCELTGMDYSNASMYDGASSLAEAALLALRHTGRKKIIMPVTIHPEYRTVVKTYTSCLDVEILEVPMAADGVLDPDPLKKSIDGNTAAVLVQQPNFFGYLEDVQRIGELTHRAGALFISCVNPVSLGILEAPGAYGADIAVGEGQPLGNPVSYGGPHFGFFTVKEEFLRKMPGRIAGATVDRVGRRSFVLTLQAREQHIRREKATSNICTNHALCASKATIFLSCLGKKGLKKLALLNLKNARETYEALLKVQGVREFSKQPFFNEFVLRIKKDPKALSAALREQKILGPFSLSGPYPDQADAYLFAVTENRTASDLQRLLKGVC